MKVHRRTPFGDRYLARKIRAVAEANPDAHAACGKILGLLHQALGDSASLGLYFLRGGKFRLRMSLAGESAPSPTIRRRLGRSALPVGAGSDDRIPLIGGDGSVSGLLLVGRANGAIPAKEDLRLVETAANRLGTIVSALDATPHFRKAHAAGSRLGSRPVPRRTRRTA